MVIREFGTENQRHLLFFQGSCEPWIHFVPPADEGHEDSPHDARRIRDDPSGGVRAEGIRLPAAGTLRFEKIIDGMKVYTAEELGSALKSAGFSQVSADHHGKKPWICLLARK